MKTKLLICLISAILICSNGHISARQIYISPSGNDLNPGTAEKPMATPTAARDKARMLRLNNQVNKPIEIIALEGEYFMLQPLMLSVDDAGTIEAPLIIKAEQGKKTIFRGGVQLTGFEKVNDKLWRVFVPQVAYNNSYFEQLYVNSRRAIRARTPNEGFYFVKKVTETVMEKGEGRAPELAMQKIEPDSVEATCFQSFSKLDYQDALIIFYHNWDNTRKRVTGFSRQNSSIHTVGQGMKPWNPINNKSRYLVENYRAALDSPGEWFLDRSGYLYYIPMRDHLGLLKKIILSMPAKIPDFTSIMARRI